MAQTRKENGFGVFIPRPATGNVFPSGVLTALGEYIMREIYTGEAGCLLSTISFSAWSGGFVNTPLTGDALSISAWLTDGQVGKDTLPVLQTRNDYATAFGSFSNALMFHNVPADVPREWQLRRRLPPKKWLYVVGSIAADTGLLAVSTELELSVNGEMFTEKSDHWNFR